MKIGIIYSRSLVSGGALRASYIANYLSKLGHDVEFIAPLKRMPWQLDFPLSLLVYTLKTIPKHYDVVFVIKPFPNACIPALLKKYQNTDTKIILDVDDMDYAYRTGLVSYISKFLQKPFPRYFDAITVHNDNLRKFLNEELSIPIEKIFNLAQGVDLELFDEKNVDNNLRKKLDLEDKNIIVYTGHLDVSTDLEPIYDAFEIVLGRIEDCRLLIVGGGPRQRYFEKIVEKRGLKNNVIFTGYLDIELLPSYMALGDMCVVYYENRLANFYRSSMKLREYLAMKKRVACNDVGELKQFGECTYQTISDVQDFANKIADVLISGGDKRELKGYKFVRQKYSWEKIIEEFERDVLVPLVEGKND
jgi:glycosyltransferase involved in cell wall biosynthesis